MVLWIAFAVMTAATLLAVLFPLGRPPPGSGENTADAVADAGSRAVYRHQLDEIETERARGLIEPAEAEAARLEVSRRLLASADAAASTKAPLAAGPSTVPRTALAVAALVPLLTLGLYLLQGSPGLPAYPFDARPEAPLHKAPVGDLIARVEARLREHPEDGKGWDAIAPAYFGLGRYRDAADAYQRAARLLGETVGRLGGFAQSSIFAADGIVTEDARRAYERVLQLEPERVEARFWLALAKEQDGKLADARTDYAGLLTEAPPDAPWRLVLSERMAAIDTRLVGGSAQPKPSAQPEQRGPSAEDMAAVQKLPPAERQKMIVQMVEGLAQRLQRDGGDLAGWTRLVRAYSVLERKQDALAALAAARKALASDERAMAELTQLAASLGLGS